MEETSSREEMTRPEAAAAVVNYPSFLQEAIKAILKCLGIERKTQQNPSTDGQVNEATACCHECSPTSTKVAVDPPPTSDPEPPSTGTTEPQAQVDPPSSSTAGDDPPEIVSLAVPQRPGTSHGSGPQIN